MKILFTSVGRRIELMQAFRKAAELSGEKCVIYGVDISDSAPALNFCDKTELVCRISEPEYIPSLLKICEREKIDALIPTIDTDLMLLSKHKADFESIGTKVMIGAPEKIAVCRDKRYTADYFISCGLKSPVPVDNVEDYQGGFPCFIKPKDGSSSINAYKVETREDLYTYAKQVDDYIIQPFIEGIEYTVDIFCDYEGNPVYITPRIRTAVRGGEVLKTKIVQDETIKAECRKLVADFKPSGGMTVQLIKQSSTGDNYYIEINPRFGGGAPLSIKAGADSALALIRILKGEKLCEQDNAATDGAVYSRFDQSVCTERGNVKPSDVKAVIFDLDDTLYSEKDYVKSGFKAVAAELKQVENAEQKLWDAFENGKAAIDAVLKAEGVYTDELKNKCLDVYRTHTPEILMHEGAEKLLELLKNMNKKIGIITDGRPEGQWAKIHALGLEDKVDEIIVTDELGGIQFRKPDDISFRIMQKKMNVHFENMMYIGDNFEKDFTAANQLGIIPAAYINKNGLYYREKNEKVHCEFESFDQIINWFEKE